MSKYDAQLLGFSILLQVSEEWAVYWPRRLLFKLENIFPAKESWSWHIVVVYDN